MLQPYRIPSNSHKKDKRLQIQTSMMIRIVSMASKDLKRLQMTSKALKWPQKKLNDFVKSNKKSELKSGYSNYVSASHGSILIEQVFSSPKEGWNYRTY